MVPRPKLLHWVALILVPFAGAAGLVPSMAPICYLVLGIFAVCVAWDAVRGMRLLDGVTAKCPPTIRWSKDRPGILPVILSQPDGKDRELTVGFSFPPEIDSSDEERLVCVPGGSRPAQMNWDCIPRKRGRFPLAACHLETATPWGFWGIRAHLPLATELRVYPDLTGERRQVAALFLQRNALGVHARRQVGKGREFEKLREYVPSDTYEDIHWKATAKRSRPVTKVFQIERTQEIYVFVDSSRLSAREWIHATPGGATMRITVLERYVQAALVLGWAAERQGDRFGLGTFGDRIHNFVRARNGQAHYSLCRDSIHALQPAQVTPDFEEMFSFIRLQLRQRALIFFLTSLDDPLLGEAFVRNLTLISRQHLVIVGSMQPPGVAPLFSDPNVENTEDVYERLAGHLRWRRLSEVGAAIRREGAQFLLLNDERLSAQVVTQYLETRRRQLL